MSQFALVTSWHLDAPIEKVWEALVAVEDWPRWWRYLHSVTTLETGDAEGIGSLRRYTWTSRLPYRLTFEMRTVALKRREMLEGVAEGDLRGTGRWQLQAQGRCSCVQYEWTVSTGKRWMNWLGPLLAPIFAWNHNQVMSEGGRGLARHLGVALLASVNAGCAGRNTAAARSDA